MQPYSQDLRDRVIAAVEEGADTQAEIAERFGVAQSTVEKWWARWRATGSCAALVTQPGPTRTLAEYAEVIRTEVTRQPDVSLAELCAHVQQHAKVQASPSMMCRELAQLKLPRKKSRCTTVNATPPASNVSGRTSARISSPP